MLENGTFLANRYEIIEKIGAGGMSDVYKAKDHSLDREVAIKVLKTEFAEDINFVTKFRAEAQAAAGLEHANIVNIYDVGNEGSLYYIVMEYVEGITLKTYIAKKGQLSYNEVLSIAIQVGRGIEAAHKKNIIHRDIKPQNIIISKEGKVKVTDFGIARAASTNTINADIMGSVHYSSPEQARNGYVSYQTDIYSLGIVMYEMCTGKVPFDGETTVAIAIQHLQGEMTPPSAFVFDLPIAVEKIIQKATMKSQPRRYATMTEMLIDLKKALINPNEDFVTIIDADDSDRTKVITEDELSKIQKEAAKQSEDEDEEEEEDGPVNSKMEKAMTIMGIAAGVVIIAIFIYLIGSAFGLFKFNSDKDTGGSKDATTEETKTAQVKVPDLLGMTEDEAKSALSAAKLGYKNGGTTSSDKYDEGLACLQSKNSGVKVDKNSTITVTFSSGKGEVAIPNVEGMTESDAKTALQNTGFKCSSSYTNSDSVEYGRVISQSPTSNNVGKEGDTITISVSSGKKLVQVPDVTNKTQSDATSTLSAAGLSVSNVSSEYSDDVAEGKIISQGIDAGKYVDSGTALSLTVSLGKETILYRFSKTISAIDNLDTAYTLYDANNKKITTWTVKATDGSKNASASGITTSNGTLSYDNGTTTGSDAVSFIKQ